VGGLAHSRRPCDFFPVTLKAVGGKSQEGGGERKYFPPRVQPCLAEEETRKKKNLRRGGS